MEKNPKSADAQRDLSTALQQEGETEEVTVLTGYVALRPKDVVRLRELAALQLGRGGTAYAQQAQEAQVSAGHHATGSSAKQSSTDEQSVGSPIDDAVTSRATQEVTDAYTKAQEGSTAAVATYDKLVAAAPSDPNVRLELAQAAQQSGDYTKAIAAYEQFLASPSTTRAHRSSSSRSPSRRPRRPRRRPARLTRGTGKYGRSHPVGDSRRAHMNFDVKTEKLSGGQHVISLTGEADSEVPRRSSSSSS